MAIGYIKDKFRQKQSEYRLGKITDKTATKLANKINTGSGSPIGIGTKANKKNRDDIQALLLKGKPRAAFKLANKRGEEAYQWARNNNK